MCYFACMQLEWKLVSDGTIALDGGAMFGVVPKTIWNRVIEADQSNRVRLGVNCLLIRTPTANVLVDTGCGAKYSAKQVDIYQIRREPGLIGELARLGVAPEQIDIVVNTHLHFDHAGGNTVVAEDGRVVPSFPNARHIVQRQEFEDAGNPNERNRASYFPENWEPLRATGQLELVEGTVEILPGLFLEPTPGHTLGHQSVRIADGNRTLFFLGDLCPTSRHVPLAWIMSYDLYPLTTLETRREVYARALEEGWLLAFQHDAEHPLGVLTVEKGGYHARTISMEDGIGTEG